MTNVNLVNNKYYCHILTVSTNCGRKTIIRSMKLYLKTNFEITKQL